MGVPPSSRSLRLARIAASAASVLRPRGVAIGDVRDDGAACGHDEYAVGHPGRLVQVVGDHEHAARRLGQARAEPVLHVQPCHRVQRRERLVQQERSGCPARWCAGRRRAAASRPRSGPDRAVRIPTARTAGRGRATFARAAAARVPRHLEAEGRVLGDGQPWEQRVALRLVGDARMRARDRCAVEGEPCPSPRSLAAGCRPATSAPMSCRSPRARSGR